MKARVKATGDIVEVKKEYDLCNAIEVVFYSNEEDPYEVYEEEELDFDVKEPPKPRYNHDYWTRLEHQYAGMAMQGIISNEDYLQSFSEDARGDLFEDIARVAADIAHALVGKMKEKEERK